MNDTWQKLKETFNIGLFIQRGLPPKEGFRVSVNEEDDEDGQSLAMA